jgi:hypothetical protein
VIHITKSVKQSVQNGVVSEFAICFSELDHIFRLIQMGVIFWKWQVSGGWDMNEFIR